MLAVLFRCVSSLHLLDSLAHTPLAVRVKAFLQAPALLGLTIRGIDKVPEYISRFSHAHVEVCALT